MVGPVARIEAGTSRSAGQTNPARVKRGRRRPSLFCLCILSIALCRLEKQGAGLVHGPIRGWMKEAWSRAHCSASSRRILPTSLTGDLTHHTSYCPPPPLLPSPSTLPPSRVPHSFFQCSDDKCKKKINLICFLTLIGRCIQSHPSFMSPVWSRSIYLQHVSLVFSFISPVWSRSIYLQLVDLAFFARPFRQLIFLWIGVIVSLFTLKEGLIC